MITGLIAPLLTPFDDKLALDQQKFNALAKRLLDTGCSGLAPFGTTGEALSVSHSERKAALQGLVEAGIDPAVMIPGTIVRKFYVESEFDVKSDKSRNQFSKFNQELRKL